MLDPARYAAAVAFAAEIHAAQRRKQSGTPYVSHLLAVSALVLEHGGDEEQAIAGLLHDSIEDVASVDGALLEARFGARVARIVLDCTDTLPGDTPGAKAPWRERKARYLEHLSRAPDDSLLVAACDKRHNLGALVYDLRAGGLGVLEGFNAGPAEQVWFYGEAVRRFAGRVPLRLELELADLAAGFERLVTEDDTRRYDAEAEWARRHQAGEGY